MSYKDELRKLKEICGQMKNTRSCEILDCPYYPCWKIY